MSCKKTALFFISIFKKGGHYHAGEEKTRPALTGERTSRSPEQRRLTRLENRKQYYKKDKRTKHTHELCNISGTVENLAPVFKRLPKREMYELMETIFSLPEM